jgi:hypothetical protein
LLVSLGATQVEEPPERIDLTKQESLDLIVLRDQVEEALRVYTQAQALFDARTDEIFNKYDVPKEAYGWKPGEGVLVLIKVKDEQEPESSSN